MIPEPSSGKRDTRSETTTKQEHPKKTGTVGEHKRAMVNRVILITLMAAVLCVLVPMLKIFLTPILLACTFATLFFPFFTVLLKFFKGNRGISALSCCIIIVLAIVIPVYLLGYLVTHQLLTLYQSIEPTVEALAKGENTGFFAHLEGNPIFTWLGQLHINWQNTTIDMLKTAGGFIAKMVNKTSVGVLEMIVGLFVTLFIMFYLFIDGERIIKKFRQLLPMRETYQDMIISRFLLVSRATVKGTLVVACLHGFCGAMLLLIFGVKTWLLWGVIISGLALIPMMGALIILVPASVIRMASGQFWQGILMLALSICIIATIDNILRPRLVGQSARMHDLLIFFSTIGALTMFGPVGVITGPVIMAFFVSITEIYTIELDEQLGIKR